MVNINCKIPLLLHHSNHNSLLSCQDDRNLSRCRSRCVNQRRKKLEDTGNHATYGPWQKLVTAVECQKCCAVGFETTTPKWAIFPPKKPIPQLFHRMALEPPIPRPVLQSGTGDSLGLCHKSTCNNGCWDLEKTVYKNTSVPNCPDIFSKIMSAESYSTVSGRQPRPWRKISNSAII